MSIFVGPAFVIHGMTSSTQGAYLSEKKKREEKGDWEDLEKYDLTGKSYLVTGSNSGIGLSAATYFARRGATVHMLCRNKEKSEQARSEIISKTGNDKVILHICDCSSMKQVRDFAHRFAAEYKLDVLVNNAGVMVEDGDPKFTDENLEVTFATNTMPSFLLTKEILPAFNGSSDPRVIFTSSGGGLTEKLLIGEDYLKQNKSTWSGMTAYSRTKRHQIVLTELFAQKYENTGIKFMSMHPGWVETPAVQKSMPKFHSAMKNRLRTPEEGADTIEWLAVSNKISPHHSGDFFRDRKPEIKHFRAGGTSYNDADRQKLWDWLYQLSTPQVTSKPAM